MREPARTQTHVVQVIPNDVHVIEVRSRLTREYIDEVAAAVVCLSHIERLVPFGYQPKGGSEAPYVDCVP